MQFIFEDLVRKYSVPCTLAVFARGAYSGGEYERGERTDTDIEAAVISMTMQKIYQSGGNLTSADRELYILKDDDIIDLDDGRTYFLEHNGRKYKVEAGGLYGEDYADFNQYTLRRVDSFDV